MPKIKDDEGSSNSESSLAPVGFTLCSHVLVNDNGIVAEYSYSLNVLIYCIIDRWNKSILWFSLPASFPIKWIVRENVKLCRLHLWKPLSLLIHVIFLKAHHKVGKKGF